MLPWRPIKKIYCRNIACIKVTNLTLKLQLQSLHWSFRFIGISLFPPSSKVHFRYTFYWSINDSCWQHQMSLRALRHGTPIRRFSKSLGLSASISFVLTHPLPALLLASFFMGPCSLLGNRMEMRATQARNFCARFWLDRLLTLLASFEFATSCQKIKVWYMCSNGILFFKCSIDPYNSNLY